MKKVLCYFLGMAVALAPAIARAQADASALDALKQQMQQLQQQMQLLQQKIEQLESAKTSAPPVAVESPASTPVPTSPAPVTTQPWSPSQPLTLARAGTAYLNIGFDAMANVGWSTAENGEVRTGHHAPLERGFSVRSVELALDGAVDPYFKGACNIALALGEDGETALELEEAYAQTTALPWNLQAKAGQFFAAFGRQNAQHAHEWAFVDQPLVLNRLFGGDGLRNPGAQLSWLAPTPWYTELMLGVFNGNGETAASFRNEESAAIHGGEPVERRLRGPQDLLFVPRVASSFDLDDTQTLLAGLSGAFGPNNSGRHAGTQIYGADLYWKWRPVNAQQGFPFAAWQTEALVRRYDAASRMTPDDPPGSAVPLPGETLTDWGFYSQVLYGFHLGWVAGLRGEFVSGDAAVFSSDQRIDSTRISSNLTWYPTEFSKLRLQYNYDHRQHAGDDHSIWLQLEFLLGAHAAHKF